MIGRWFSALGGVWLCLSAPLLAHSRNELTNGVFTGIAIFLVACFATAASGLRRMNTLLGLWAVASPFALGYHDRAVGLDLIAVGVLVLVASLRGPHVARDRRQLSWPVA